MVQVQSPNGKYLEIDDEQRALVYSTTEPVDAHINRLFGKVWSIPFEGLNPANANSNVIYIKNTGDKTLHISDVRLMADTAVTQIRIAFVTGTAAGGTAVTPISRTGGSPATVTGTVETGVDITGLTNSGTIFFMQLDTVNKEYHLSTSSRIRLPKGQAMAISVETATANITGVVSIVEED
jgi:hypothetical protein